MIGYITPVKGNSDLLRDWLIENGARWSRDWGWYFEGEAPTLPIGLTASPPIHWEELQSEKATGEYIGNVGDRVNGILYCSAIYKTSTNKLCYHFKTLDGDIAIWFTTPKEIEINKPYAFTGTVKKHQVFRGQRQTIMTRCKYEYLNL